MHSISTAAAFITALAAIASSEELKASDVPQACTTICGPIVTLTNTCDIDPNMNSTRRRGMLLRRDAEGDTNGVEEDGPDEAIEAQCICKNTSFNVGRVVALCVACLVQNKGKTEGEIYYSSTQFKPPFLRFLTSEFPDMSRIMSQCSFTSTTYVPAATSAVAGVTVQATKPAVPTGVGSNTAKTSGTAAPSATKAVPGTSASTPLLGGPRYRIVVAAVLTFAFASFL